MADPNSIYGREDGTEPARPATFSQQLAESIRYYRHHRGLSLSELSRRAGVAKGTLSRLEVGEGNPTIMTLAALAGELHVTPSDFFVRNDGQSGESPRLEGPGLGMQFIGSIRTASIWELYETVIPWTDEPIYSPTHGGTEHLLLLDGAAEVGPVERPVHLTAGCHTSFPGDEAHLYWSKDGLSRALLIMDYPAETD
ncbi:XRE family transcriptional regulator [Halofilum ochraceum]|uniref:XRE family transcriptional regulator n=1 Tax=Halofilum ochraceum TaxID=1611323 RepID=UPI000832C60A|nr:XRE family transcriptional regulator [Halofilum ochraceum]